MSDDSLRGLRSGLVVVGVALIATCYGFARFAYGLFAPQLTQHFFLSRGLSGLVGAGSYVGYCVAIGGSTLLTGRWGPRWVAVLAGAVAAVGTGTVAAAPNAVVLAAGVLVGGLSTGIASPPLAATVAVWVREGVQDTAQTLVNAGTGIGVLVSGPVALILLDRWRLAWAFFAVTAAVVTVCAARAIPRGGATPPSDDGQPARLRPPGATVLLLAASLMGLSSTAVWTLGRGLIETARGSDSVGPVVWTVMGAAGILGAFAGPAVDRLGLRTSWTVLMLLLAIGTAGLAAGARYPVLAVAAGAVFGAAYIALTGVLLVWATRTYPRPSLGVGLVFLMIAAGQAVGAPIAGGAADATSLPLVFYACAIVAATGSTLRSGRD